MIDYNVTSNGITKKNSLNEVIYENPYNDSQFDDISTPVEKNREEYSAQKSNASNKNYQNETFAADLDNSASANQ